ncbi:hypothetical protein [Acidiluteibacter ferrifornacis]|uniref:VanZ-like domain-containing protein n=1 Tax=Acidiluteibacter ferrifornacis TaxID=2692424 RepID=A0A6N9ND78_9FLAO|nr:hypothetical protein [Acidiluteibacter ferrifornacis]NBG64526.1 hypothetical protein [Acidiluteibacter ferrifornacis]
MIKRLLHFSFWIPAALFVVHQILQKGVAINLSFIDDYLDPFCLGALVPPLLLIEREWLFKQTHFAKIEFVILLLVLMLASEWLLPFLSSEFVADPFDALAIFIGGCWFWWFRGKVGIIPKG